MWKDVVPWLLGPAGIVLGWWLNQQSLRGNAERLDKQVEAVAERQRVLDAVRLARDTSSQIRSLLHATYLKSKHGKAPVGFQDAMSEFNQTRDQFRNAVMALRVQGPTWALEGAEQLDVDIARLTELAMLMQPQITTEHMYSVNAGMPELAQRLSAYVDTVSRRYNSSASTLPAQPDLETEGRWQPYDGCVTAGVCM